MSTQDHAGGASTGAPAELPDELTIFFRKPITVGTETATAIVLREPEVREIATFEKAVGKVGPIDAMSGFIAGVAGVSKAIIDRMGARDFKTAQEYLGNFLDQDGSPKTGETS